LFRHVASSIDKFKQNKVKDSADSEETQLVDIEDISSVSTPLGQKCLTVTKTTFVHERPPEEASEELPLSNTFDNYSVWIKAMCPQWRKRHESHLDFSGIVPSMFNFQVSLGVDKSTMEYPSTLPK